MKRKAGMTMSEKYRDQIYEARKTVLMAAGMSEDDAHDVIKSIKATETYQYGHDKDLSERMKPLEAEGRVLDIYNNMYTRERIELFVERGMEQKDAIELSMRLQETENIMIEKFDRDNGNLKEQRDNIIKEAGACLNDLKAYVHEGSDIEKTVNASMTVNAATNKHVSKAMANRYYMNDILAIPLGQNSSYLSSALTLGKCRKDLAADGMPEPIADVMIVDAAIEIEQSKGLADAIKSMPEPKIQQEV